MPRFSPVLAALIATFACASSTQPQDAYPRDGDVADAPVDQLGDVIHAHDNTDRSETGHQGDAAADVADATRGILGRSHWDVIQQAPAVTNLSGAQVPLFIVATFSRYAYFMRGLVVPCVSISQTVPVHSFAAGTLTNRGGFGETLALSMFRLSSCVQYGYYDWTSAHWSAGQSVVYRA